MKFSLVYKNMKLGTLLFHNGEFTFQLDENIQLEQWDRQFGIIPLKGKRKVKSDSLFAGLNVRLPIQLRKRGVNDREKLEYIHDKGLRVISDQYNLQPA